MPFGDHTKTRLVLVSREDWYADMSKGRDGVPTRVIRVETVDPPWWWSEYLMAEWKRKHSRSMPGPAQSGWQQDHDKWAATVRLWDRMDFGVWLDHPEKPARHGVWETGAPDS